MSALDTTRTLHLTNAWHPESGGIRTFYHALLSEAEHRNRWMTVVVPGDRDTIVSMGARTRIVTLRAPRAPFLDRRYRLLWPHRFVAPLETILWRVIAEANPDVIEICDKYLLCHVAGLIKRRRGPRPTVIGLSQERLDDALSAHAMPRGVAGRVAARYLRAVYLRQFDAHVANSEYTVGELRRAATDLGPSSPLHWRLRDRIYVQPLGVDLTDFTPAARSASLRSNLVNRLGAHPPTHLAVFAGRLSSEKHVDVLVPAIERCRKRGLDLALVVAGDGPRADVVAAAGARRLPGRLLMLGHMADRATLAQLLASTDVFVHPNPREPFGIGPLEAMASGVPVVAPASGGVLSYATAANAWLAAPGADGLAAALETCLRSRDEAARRRKQAIVDAASFSWPLAAARYFATYDAIHAHRLQNWAGTASSSTDRPLIVS